METNFSTKPEEPKMRMTKRNTENVIRKYILSNYRNMNFEGDKSNSLKTIENATITIQEEFQGVGKYRIVGDLRVSYCVCSGSDEEQGEITESMQFQCYADIGEDVNNTPVVKSIDQPIVLKRM